MPKITEECGADLSDGLSVNAQRKPEGEDQHADQRERQCQPRRDGDRSPLVPMEGRANDDGQQGQDAGIEQRQRPRCQGQKCTGHLRTRSERITRRMTTVSGARPR